MLYVICHTHIRKYLGSCIFYRENYTFWMNPTNRFHKWINQSSFGPEGRITFSCRHNPCITLQAGHWAGLSRSNKPFAWRLLVPPTNGALSKRLSGRQPLSSGILLPGGGVTRVFLSHLETGPMSSRGAAP